MVKRLIGVVALGPATLVLGAVPAHAATATVSTTVVTAKATTAKYVEWAATSAAPVKVSKYVEW
jgi:hypothetical protein